MRSENFLLAAAGALSLMACSGDFHSDRGLREMSCDETGCFFCQGGDCEEYRCDETHQCPMDRVCTTDHHCMPEGVSTGGRCGDHGDCAKGEICTLDGQCVASPGGGPGTDPDTADASGDTGADPDAGLPDHPEDTCATNADCGSDGTCVNGGCYFGCGANGACPPGQVCNDLGGVGATMGMQCRVAPPENECTFNGECGTDHACLEGTCYDRCVETLDCPAHTRCGTGICIADVSPVLQCSGAGSCLEGKACVDGKCLAACGEGGICDAGFACDLGYCARTVTCFDQEDCDGRDCIDGACSL